MSTKPKKYDQAVVSSLIDQINEASKKKTAQTEIKLSLKENNIIKAINPEFSEDLLGEWNGYGYTRLGKHLCQKNYKEVKKALKKMLKNSETKKERKEKTPEEKIEAWARRLCKLTGIELDEALKIAEEKIEYKIEKIEEALDVELQGWKIPAWYRQAERDRDRIYSDRSKALQRIQDEQHARAILTASHRHNSTNYESQLVEARELVSMGQLDKEDVQDYARRTMQY